MTYRFRSASPSDVNRCLAIRTRTRQNAISEAELALRGVTQASWRRDVENGLLLGCVCTLHEEVVGFCYADQTTGEIVVLALLPAHEFKGIGKKLISMVVEDLRERGFKRMFLECSTDPNVRSFGFYRHLGWKPTGVRTAHGDEILEFFR